jgi:hypothetical protein
VGVLGGGQDLEGRGFDRLFEFDVGGDAGVPVGFPVQAGRLVEEFVAGRLVEE